MYVHALMMCLSCNTRGVANGSRFHLTGRSGKFLVTWKSEGRKSVDGSFPMDPGNAGWRGAWLF